MDKSLLYTEEAGSPPLENALISIDIFPLIIFCVVEALIYSQIKIFSCSAVELCRKGDRGDAEVLWGLRLPRAEPPSP